MEPESNKGNGPTRSSYDRGYWLRRCEGFLVETPTKRIGRVTRIRYGEATNQPEALEIRAGLFGRTRILISVHDITDIAPGNAASPSTTHPAHSRPKGLPSHGSPG